MNLNTLTTFKPRNLKTPLTKSASNQNLISDGEIDAECVEVWPEETEAWCPGLSFMEEAETGK